MIPLFLLCIHLVSPPETTRCFAWTPGADRWFLLDLSGPRVRVSLPDECATNSNWHIETKFNIQDPWQWMPVILYATPTNVFFDETTSYPQRYFRFVSDPQ